MNLRPSGYEPDELPDCSTPLAEDFSPGRKKFQHPVKRRHFPDSKSSEPEVQASAEAANGTRRLRLRRGRSRLASPSNSTAAVGCSMVALVSGRLAPAGDFRKASA